MNTEVSITERLDRLRERLRDAPQVVPAGNDRPDRDDAPEPRSFSDWQQWGQFRQQQ